MALSKDRPRVYRSGDRISRYPGKPTLRTIDGKAPGTFTLGAFRPKLILIIHGVAPHIFTLGAKEEIAAIHGPQNNFTPVRLSSALIKRLLGKP